MIEYWSVIGRACVDGGFREQIFYLCRYRQRDHSKLGDLYHFLCDKVGYGFRLSRWELCDLNRLFHTCQHDRYAPGDLQSITETWTKLAGSHPQLYRFEVYALLGLMCIDGQARGSYTSDVVSQPSSLRALAYTPPLFKIQDLRDDELKALGAFLASATGGKRLAAIEKAIWVVPALRSQLPALFELLWAIVKVVFKLGRVKTRCSAGHTMNTDGEKLQYLHLSPPFFDALAAVALGSRGENPSITEL
jgi:hypothetical protein